MAFYRTVLPRDLSSQTKLKPFQSWKRSFSRIHAPIKILVQLSTRRLIGLAFSDSLLQIFIYMHFFKFHQYCFHFCGKLPDQLSKILGALKGSEKAASSRFRQKYFRIVFVGSDNSRRHSGPALRESIPWLRKISFLPLIDTIATYLDKITFVLKSLSRLQSTYV